MSEARGWYTESLGFRTAGTVPAREPYVYASLQRDGVELMESVRGQAFIRTPLRKQPYGDWEFEVSDPNGYILVFSELTD